jgi:ribosomal protein S27E
MSDAMKRSRETMLSDGIKRNDKIQPKTTSSVPLANLATSQTRTLVGVNIERNESGKLICPNTSCDEAFDNEKDLTWHLRKDIKANGNVCILCPPVVNRKPLTDRMLTEHIKSHLSSKMIECQICGKPILESKQDQHDLKHHTTQEDAEHWCTPCAKSFITAGALERHNAERHEDAEKMECPKCGRTMTNASYETHRKLACKADPTIPMRERVSCPACHRTILKKNIHQHYRKHERNDAILDFLDALPVLEDGDEGMESGDEMDGDNAGDDEDEE